MGFRLMALALLLALPSAAIAADFNCTTSACVNGQCNNTTGSCICPTGSFLAFSGPKCDQLIPIPMTSLSKLTSTSTTYLKSELIDLTSNDAFKGGIPLSAGQLATRIYVCSNGYLTFHYDFCTTRVDLLKGFGAPPFVAPLATSFDFRNTSLSEVSYMLVPLVDAVSQLRQMRDNNTDMLGGATAAVVVNWVAMTPPPGTDANQKATFQLILFTDFEKITAAVRLYSTVTLRDYFDWLPTLIGMSTSGAGLSGGASILAGTRSDAAALILRNNTFGSLRATVSIDTLYKGTSLNYRQRCFNEAAATPLLPAVSSDTAGQCPPTLKQARWDPRYQRVSVNQTAFSLIASVSQANATQITCAYHDVTGGLLSANIPSQFLWVSGESFSSAMVQLPHLLFC